jgi:hypothetical protein
MCPEEGCAPCRWTGKQRWLRQQGVRVHDSQGEASLHAGLGTGMDARVVQLLKVVDFYLSASVYARAFSTCVARFLPRRVQLQGTKW